MANCIIFNGGTDNPEDRSKIQRNLGPYRIASALEDAGYSTFVLDYCILLTTDEIIEAIEPHLGPETLWVGFSSTFYWLSQEHSNELNNRSVDYSLESMYFSKYAEIKRIMSFVKEKSTAKFIYGGARAPFFIVDKNIDYYVLGNADISTVDITNYISGKVDKIQHFSEVDIDGEKRILIDSNHYPEPTMDNVSTHWWNKDYNILSGEALPIELARGCIFKCKFCSYPLLGKKKGTYLRDPEEIKDELIKTWESHGTDTYYITDDTFNDDNDKIEALHKVFTSLPFKLKFSSFLRVDLINRFPHQADLLAEMGLIGVFFGLETMHPKSAVSIGKGLHPNKVKDRLYWLAEKWKNKVNIESGFILGLPYDDMQYFYELVTWSLEKDNPLQAIHFYPLMLFHFGDKKPEYDKYGSEFSINPDVYGYEFDNTVYSWKLRDSGLSYKSCLKIAEQYNSLRRPMNKIGAFAMPTLMNIGVTLEDLYTLTEFEIKKKYNIPRLNYQKTQEYKRLLGLK
jgi:Radical SAM superfamily